ncbi:anti-sigma factor [Streptococcus suis]|nr:anti-sigma factor [Streptococcus suis]
MKTFELVIKKNKRKHLLRTVALSLLAVLFLLLVSIQTIKIMIGEQGEKEYRYFKILTEIAYPNINHDGIKIQNTGYLSGKIYFDLHKDLAGVPMAFGQHEVYYTLLGSYYDFAQHSPGDTLHYLYDHTTNTKLPIFYNINEKKENGQEVATELSYLREMKGQLVEVAITFDKKYTLDAIKKMIPNNIKKNWYWIGTEGKQSTYYYRPEQLLGLKPDSLQLVFEDMVEEHQTAIDYMKEFSESVNQERISYLNIPVEDVQHYIEKFSDTDFTKQEEIDKLEFAGIILTGRAEDFVQLEDKDWIYASSIGASVSTQPYYQLHIN